MALLLWRRLLILIRSIYWIISRFVGGSLSRASRGLVPYGLHHGPDVTCCRSVSNLCAIAVETPLWVVAGTFDADDGELSVDSADRTLDERIEKCSTVGVPKTLQI